MYISGFCTKKGHKKSFNVMITTFENRCELKNNLVVLRPIFDTTHKEKNRLKYTCEIYITNWYYSYKVGISFTMYQIMRLKGASWAGPRY